MTQHIRVLAKPAFSHGAYNPYQTLLYGHLKPLGVEVEEFSALKLLLRKYHILHFHWPELTLRPAAPISSTVKAAVIILLIAIARIRGARLLWTVHNVESHDPFIKWVDAAYWRAFIAMVDGCISLSETAKGLAVARYPALESVPFAVVPHGHYRGAYPDSLSCEEAREGLGIERDNFAICFIGLIRPYKNVPRLIEAFGQIDSERLRLMIAGRPTPAEQADALSNELVSLARGDDRVILDLRFIEDADIQAYLRAADLVVLPYAEILNSGSALLALSFDCPIVVPDLGSLGELKSQVGPSWVWVYSGKFTHETLSQAIEWATKTERPERAPLDALAWETLAKRTRDFYVQVLGSEVSERS